MPGLPMAALMFVCPGLAALILVRRAQGSQGVRALLSRAIDYRGVTPSAWYAPLLLLNPAVFALSYLAMRAFGSTVPSLKMQVVPTLALCLVFLVSAFGEELGWSGYAIDPLQHRWGALRASLLLGIVWAAFHWIALLQVHRSFRVDCMVVAVDRLAAGHDGLVLQCHAQKRIRRCSHACLSQRLLAGVSDPRLVL